MSQLTAETKRKPVVKVHRGIATRQRSSPPRFVGPQLCKLVASPPAGREWSHEVKFDGYRIQLRVKDGKADLRTRKGLNWSAKFPQILLAAKGLKDCLIDGEIVALNPKGISDFGMLQSALSEGRTGALVFFAFDCMHIDGHDLRKVPLAERQMFLRNLIRQARPRSRRIRVAPRLAGSGDSVLKLACRRGLEGVISKRKDAAYRSGRNDLWRKSKCRPGQEVVIGGWRGTANKLRSLLVGVHRKNKTIYMGHVGSGFTAGSARQLLNKLKARERRKPGFANAPHGRDLHWVRPTLVAEIEYENVTREGLFRQATFKGLRTDKPAGAVVQETPARFKTDKPRRK